MSTPDFKEAYSSVLKAFVNSQQEQYLAEAAELGREMVRAGVPPEEIAEIHEEAILRLAAEFPNKTLLESARRISAPLMEMLMAYGLAFREQQDEQKLAARALIESEAKFRSIFQSASVGIIVVLDAKGNVVEWNRGAERAFGYSKQEVVGNPMTRFMPECYREAHRKGVVRAVNQGELLHGEVTRQLSGLRKNGEEFPLELTLGSWKRGKTLYFSGIMLDITERKQFEQALRRAQKMDAIGRLGGGIAHDFNNILGIILGNSSLLALQLAADDKAHERIEIIKKAAERAADLTRHLLGFSRRHATEVAVIDINDVIVDMRSLIAHTLTPAVEVKHLLAADLWSTEIDPGDLQDALLNLILNARDAMPNGGQLTIETRNCTLDEAYCAQNPGVIAGEYVRLAVIDSGGGILLEHQERIFEPFFTTKPEGKGTGLGLAMTYGFVKRSKGTIQVYSEPDVGTTFHLYLPRTSREQPVRSNAQQPKRLLQGQETILAIDDEKELLELARRSLQALGYRVLVANDAREALERLAEHPTIDLLFSDVVMPGGIDGYQLAKQATAAHPNLKVLLTSGFIGKAADDAGQLHFGVSLLNKPYTQSELAQRVRETLAKPAPAAMIDPPGTPAETDETGIEWRDDFCIGIEAMDNDHRGLLPLLKRSRQAAASGDRVACMAILDQLRDYTQTHFLREEALMAACAYPGLDSHVKVHQMLIRKIGIMGEELCQGTMNIAELVTFIYSWWIDHTLFMDRAYVPYSQGKAKLIEQALESVSPCCTEKTADNR